MPEIEISCPVNPSEDPEKVRAAVLSLFPDADVALEGGALTGSAPGLERFSSQIRRQRILDAARAVLLRGRRGSGTVFRLNKQAAYAGQVSFAEEGAVLGPIRVAVRGDGLDALIDRVAPVTVDGEEVLQ